MPRHSYLVGGRILTMMILHFKCFDTGYLISGFLDYLFYNCIFDRGFRFNLQSELCRIFGRFSGVRKFRNHVLRLGFGFSFFKQAMIS